MYRLYSIITLLVMSVTGLAVSAESLCLTLHFTNGETARFAIPEKPVMTFEENQIKVTTAENVEGIYDRSKIADFDFTMGVTASAADINSDADYSVDFTSGSILRIAGNDVTSAAAYNVAGQKVAYASVDCGTVVLNLQSLPSGVYVIEIPGHESFKIKK